MREAAVQDEAQNMDGVETTIILANTDENDPLIPRKPFVHLSPNANIVLTFNVPKIFNFLNMYPRLSGTPSKYFS